MSEPKSNYVAAGEVREWLQELLREEVLNTLTAKIAERDFLLGRVVEWVDENVPRHIMFQESWDELSKTIAALYAPPQKSNAESAREWVSSPEGQEAISKALDEARAVTEALKPQPIDPDKLREPFI